MRYQFQKRSGVQGVVYEDGDITSEGELPDDVVRSLLMHGAIVPYGLPPGKRPTVAELLAELQRRLNPPTGLLPPMTAVPPIVNELRQARESVTAAFAEVTQQREEEAAKSPTNPPAGDETEVETPAEEEPATIEEQFAETVVTDDFVPEEARDEDDQTEQSAETEAAETEAPAEKEPESKPAEQPKPKKKPKG